MINWEFVVSKFGEFGNFVFDRQFWFKFIFPVVFAFGILPYINEQNAEALSDQAVAIAQVIIPLVSSLLVGISKNKKVQSEIEDLIDTLKKAV